MKKENKLPKQIMNKANKVIESITNGKSHANFKGKRLQRNRNIISIPLSNNYRMLLDESSKYTHFLILSHAEYNCKVRTWR